MKPSKLIKFLETSINLNHPVLVMGEPGLGKTAVVEQAAHNINVPIHVRHAICMEPIDFRGLPCLERGDKPEDSFAQFVPYGDLKIMLDATEPVVFFYDDLGQSSQSVQKGMMQLFLQREVNGQKISDHVRFLSATNRRGDKAGVNGLITPLISRQKAVINFTLDVTDWIKWAHENKMPPILIAFIHFRGEEFLLDFDPNKVDEHGNDLVQQPSPRTVANVGDWMNAGFNLATDFEVFEGTIGRGFATELAGFIRLYDQLGQMPNLIAKGDEVTCPSDPASIYALASALASRSGEPESWKNISNWCMNNMPREFQQVVLLDAEMIHGEDIKNTTQYVEWTTKLEAS